MNEAKLNELKEALRATLAEQTRVLDHLIHVLSQTETIDPELKEITNTIVLMLQSVGVSVHSILRLTETIDMAIKDCFGICRTVSEMCINIAYIAASDIEVARRARAHALQKKFRDLSRYSDAADVNISVKSNVTPDASEIPGLREAIDMFTDKKGREIRDWATDSLDERIRKVAAVSRRASTSLAGSKFSIYRHSSELLHGTYFGVVYFWTSPTGAEISRQQFSEHWVQNHFVTIFTAVFFGVVGAVECCADRFELDQFDESIQKAITKTRVLLDPEFADG